MTSNILKSIASQYKRVSQSASHTQENRCRSSRASRKRKSGNGMAGRNPTPSSYSMRERNRTYASERTRDRTLDCREKFRREEGGRKVQVPIKGRGKRPEKILFNDCFPFFSPLKFLSKLICSNIPFIASRWRVEKLLWLAIISYKGLIYKF